jgi:tripartite-type tricarboxylate transporter receptor subunit TctC
MRPNEGCARSIARYVVALVLAAVSAAGFAQESSYPARLILLLTPFGPGVGPDLYMRPLSAKLGERLGQKVLLESKVGAGGALAVLQTVTSPPDGYTMTVVSSANITQPLVQPGIGYDAASQLTHITQLAASSLVLVVPASSEVLRLQDLISVAKANPGKFNYGSGGVGTNPHLSAATLQVLTGMDAVHIPFKNPNDVIPSMLRGDVQFAFQAMAFAAPFARSGKLRVLGTTGMTRLREFPDVPTMNELLKNGLFVQETWTGLALPEKAPAAIVRRLFTEVAAAFPDSAVQKGVEAAGGTPALSRTPEEHAGFVRKENEKWREIVKLTGARAD